MSRKLTKQEQKVKEAVELLGSHYGFEFISTDKDPEINTIVIYTDLIRNKKENKLSFIYEE